MINDLKEYVPWEDLGITEIDYWKRLYVIERTQADEYRQALQHLAKRTEITYGVERPTSEAKIAIDVLSRFGD